MVTNRGCWERGVEEEKRHGNGSFRGFQYQTVGMARRVNYLLDTYFLPVAKIHLDNGQRWCGSNMCVRFCIIWRIKHNSLVREISHLFVEKTICRSKYSKSLWNATTTDQPSPAAALPTFCFVINVGPSPIAHAANSLRSVATKFSRRATTYFESCEFYSVWYFRLTKQCFFYTVELWSFVESRFRVS